MQRRRVSGQPSKGQRVAKPKARKAAQAVAEYLPQRPRPKSYEGLKKNLRLSPDGRWRWHWDPRFLDGPRAAGDARQDHPCFLLSWRAGAARVVGREDAGVPKGIPPAATQSVRFEQARAYGCTSTLIAPSCFFWKVS